MNGGLGELRYGRVSRLFTVNDSPSQPFGDRPGLRLVDPHGVGRLRARRRSLKSLPLATRWPSTVHKVDSKAGVVACFAPTSQ